MEYYYIEPEVAGGWGENTVFEETYDNVGIVHKLHYVFEDWFGDCILTSSPCFIVTEGASREIQKHSLTGFEFDEVEVSTSDVFKAFKPTLKLPKFVWLKITGEAGKDDFGLERRVYLVISERALNILQPLGLSHADITPFKLEKCQPKPLTLLQKLRRAIAYAFGGGSRP